MFKPYSHRLHPNALVAIRIIQGLLSGMAFPSFYAMFNNWTSLEERASLLSIAWCGVPIATMVNFPLSSALCHTGIDGGWPMVFYVPGNSLRFTKCT